MSTCLQEHFPQFAQSLAAIEAEDIAPPVAAETVQAMEQALQLTLPPSYKRFLRCTRGFMAFGGDVLLGQQHPFFHKAGPTGGQRAASLPTEGMLCFADFALEADGDQLLFDVRHPDAAGEYPVYYYAHAQRPPAIRKIADSFGQWLTEFPAYEEFADDE